MVFACLRLDMSVVLGSGLDCVWVCVGKEDSRFHHLLFVQ